MGITGVFQLTRRDAATQGDHIAACIDYVRANGHHTLDVKDAAEEWWVQNVIEH